MLPKPIKEMTDAEHAAYVQWRMEQSKAIAAVQHAKYMGRLPYLTGAINCVDCADPASKYDHRDYGRPLDVEPVCQKCNHKRGPAKLPEIFSGTQKEVSVRVRHGLYLASNPTVNTSHNHAT
jgi:hypothetical protein